MERSKHHTIILKRIKKQVRASQYRPVSLTSVICKLLERLIKDHLVDFLVKNNLINPSQHGFLKARSCLTNMLCFLEDVTKWVDEGSPVDIIYLNFKKAFDKVPHQRLLLKLKDHGIGNGMINWIEKWLIDRRQRVVVDLGLTISADMKVSEQCAIAAAKGNQIIGLIRRNIVYKEKELIIPLYKTIVRPHLEYCIQAWRPCHKKDIDILERVQRRLTKMIQKLRNISYEMRLKECGLTTLETRRL